MEGPQIRRKQVTYGKRLSRGPQSRSFAFGFQDFAPNDGKSTSPSKLQKTTSASIKSRKLTVRQKDPTIFDVSSSEDEASTSNAPSPPLRQSLARKIAPLRHNQKSYVDMPAPKPRAGKRNVASPTAAASVAHKRKRAPPKVKPPTTLPSPSSSDSPARDGSPIRPPGTPVSSTPEPTTSQSTPISERRARTTPKQTKLWANLFESDNDTALENLSLHTVRVKKETSAPRVRTSVHRRLIDTLKPSDTSEVLLEDELTGEDHDLTMDGELDQGEHLMHDVEPPDRGPTSQLQQTSTVTGGPRITYAQSRSYLDDSMIQSVDDLLAQPLDEQFSMIATKHLSGPRSKPSKSDYDLDSAEEEGESSQMKNIHELRSAGDNQRFQDETSSLIDEVQGDGCLSMSSKRSALLTLTSKLVDESFRNRFIQGSFEQQLFSKVKNETDCICLTAFAAASLFILQRPPDGHCAATALDAGILDAVERVLGNERDLARIARDRQSNMSKIAQAMVFDFRQLVLKHAFDVDSRETCLTPRQVGLKALEALVRRARESGNMEALLRPELLRHLMSISKSSLGSLSHTWKKKKGGSSALELEVVLSTLESCTISPACVSNAMLWTPGNVDATIHTLECTLRLKSIRYSTLRPLALRLALNLANNNCGHSDRFAQAGFVSVMLSLIVDGFGDIAATIGAGDEDEAVDAQAEGFDNLILGLGAMLNLAELSGEVRKMTASTSSGQVEALASVFAAAREQTGEAESLAESRANVAYGYLAVLLASLAMDKRLEALIVARLPQRRPDTLIGAVEEFLAHHRKADEREQSNEWAAFTKRLQAVADALRAKTTL